MKRGLEAITKGIGQRRSRYYRTLAVFLCLIVVTAVAMMCIGAVNYTPWYILSVLTGKSTEGIFMIKTLRLPRMLAGLTAGFAFGIAGGVFQTMLRNPLANPNIIGITSASSVGAVFCILILHTQGWTAFGGSILMAVLSALLIFILANHKKFTIGKMVLIGLGFQAMMNSIINYLLLIANENDLGTAMRWMSGTLNAVQMNNLYVKDYYVTHNGGDNDGAMTLTCVADGVEIDIRTTVLTDEDGKLIAPSAYAGKTIDVKGIVDQFDGTYQIKVMDDDYITVHE